LQSNCQIKHQKRVCLEGKDVPEKKSLAFLFEEINTVKRQLQLKAENEKTAGSKKRKA
jgi:hypothetical protein